MWIYDLCVNVCCISSVEPFFFLFFLTERMFRFCVFLLTVSH